MTEVEPPYRVADAVVARSDCVCQLSGEVLHAALRFRLF
jgi:hypothetical protein